MKDETLSEAGNMGFGDTARDEADAGRQAPHTQIDNATVSLGAPDKDCGEAVSSCGETDGGEGVRGTARPPSHVGCEGSTIHDR